MDCLLCNDSKSSAQLEFSDVNGQNYAHDVTVQVLTSVVIDLVCHLPLDVGLPLRLSVTAGGGPFNSL